MAFFRIVRARSSNGQLHEYVRFIERSRDGHRVQERTLFTLGRRDQLPDVLAKLAALIGLPEYIAAACADADLREAAMLWERLDAYARADILATMRARTTPDDHTEAPRDTPEALTFTGGQSPTPAA